MLFAGDYGAGLFRGPDHKLFVYGLDRRHVYDLCGNALFFEGVARDKRLFYEQTVRGRLSELAQRFAHEPPKGECVITLSGAADEGEASGETMDEMLTRLMSGGMSAKDAAKQTALVLDMPKNTVYQRAVELKNS